MAFLQREQVQSVAIPPLGCGNGGLNWSEVRPLIVEALAAIPDVAVHLYEPQTAREVDAMPVATRKPNLNSNGAALLALLMDYGISGYRLTRLEIQKLAYFLQVAGQPSKLEFVKEQYGPYAEALNHVLHRMEGHFIRGFNDPGSEASVDVLAEGVESANAVLAEEDHTAGRVQRVAELIEGFETPHGMEILASVHWVTQESAAAKNDWTECFRMIKSWNERKQRVFPAHHVQSAFEQLRSHHWI